MKLTKQRGGVRATITGDINAIEQMLNGDVAAVASQLRAVHKRLEFNLDRLLKMDDKVQSAITDETQMDNEIADSEQYNNNVLAKMAEIEELLMTTGTAGVSAAPPAAPDHSAAQAHSTTAAFKLPKFEMSTFGGDPLEWQHFWDVYKTAIHDNPAMNDVQKFSYLCGYLRDDALALARGYKLTAENYKQVIEALQERYGDKQRAQFAHFQALIAIEHTKSNNLSEVQRVYNDCETHIRSLVALELEESTFAVVFVPIILSKLPVYLATKLCEKNGTDKWSLTNMREWIKSDLRAREMGKSTSGSNNNPGQGTKKVEHQTFNRTRPTTTASSLAAPDSRSQNKRYEPATAQYTTPCVFCNRTGHRHSDCRTYPDTESRLKALKQRPQRSCFICLKNQHRPGEICYYKNRPCFHCDIAGHHPGLCHAKFGPPEQSRQTNSGKGYSRQPAQNKGGGIDKLATPKKTAANVTVAQEESNEVDVSFLKTAVITVKNEDDGKSVRGRCLMDDASSRTYVTENFARRLGLKNIGSAYISVGKFGTNKRTTMETKRTRFVIQCKDGSLQPVLAIVTPVISCPVARHPIDPVEFPIVNKLDLAEPLNKVPDNLEIDILIGSDQYYNFVSTSGAHICDPGLVFVPSRMGYLTAGVMPVNCAEDGAPESTLVLLRPESHDETMHCSDSCNIERFWQIEDIGVKSKKTENVTDEEALRQFHDTIEYNDEDGRYHVTWPWKTKEPDLPNNFGLAYGRLRSTYSRLQQDSDLLKQYDDIIKSQFDKGIIEPAPPQPDGLVYYVPHHAVITPWKTTTKVRIVYDASSKVKKDVPSLNDCLLRGRVILDDLCGLLMRFRLYKVALVSDIEKAFHQVRLQTHERDVARFLWVKDVSKPPTGDNLVSWRFTSVFFGAISSSFLLGATIDHHLRRSDGAVAKKISENLYVDNVVTGEDSPSDAINHYQEAKGLFLGASMNLREFYSNSSVVRDAIAPEDRGKADDPKVLGVGWNVQTDTLSCSGMESTDATITKRLIAHQAGQIWDPCGWFSPIVVTGKLLTQELWKRKLAWDERVPYDLCKEWRKVSSELAEIPNISIPRYIGPGNNVKLELHAFCDASTLASAVAVYLRKEGPQGTTCDLLFSKTKLAPLKQELTIPRLELVGVVMGVHAIEYIEEALRLPISQKVVWSDSECVLYWITKEKLGTKFVERRINEIRKKEGLTFRHIPSEHNPADIPSRGCTADELRNSSLWWHGPTFLQLGQDEWPKDRTARVSQDEVFEETTQMVVVETPKPHAIIDSQKFSSLHRLLRVTAYVQRFTHNCRLQKEERATGALTVHETALARNYWEKTAQGQGFPALQQRLNAKLLKQSCVAQLNVFRDENGLLRCRGRLSNSDLSYDTQNPILLPKVHPFTKLVIRHAHVTNLHAGVAQTLHALRQRYWVPHGRQKVKELIRTCQRCRRVDGGPFEIPPAPALPTCRVVEQLPFGTTGLDYLGFLTVKVSQDVKQKVWVCLFTCAVTRAIHLELIENQSAEEFHLALRRFFALHGCPKLIISDNASQFLTVESAMSKLWSQLLESPDLEDIATTSNIEWKKIPQVAPWMGGFYERLVGTVKKCLKKTLDGLCVNISELRTVLAEITAIVNSRPLLYVEDDVKSRQLTPADLLGQFDKRLLPTFDLEGAAQPPPSHGAVDNIMARWKRLQAVTSMFWNDWRQGYLTSLREKHANAAQRNSSLLQPTVGSVVQIKDEKLPRAQWRLGKIVKLITSADGNVRSVILQLSSGRNITRPLKLLYPLEMHIEKPENDVVLDVTPFTVPHNFSDQSEEEEFFGFDSEDIEIVTREIENLEISEEKLLRKKPTPPKTPLPSRPRRKKAIEAREKLRLQLAKAARRSPWESSDEE